MTVVTNLVQNAQYAERVCEHDAWTMNQLAATMQQMGRNIFDGFRQMQQQQQQERQEFQEFRGNGRGVLVEGEESFDQPRHHRIYCVPPKFLIGLKDPEISRMLIEREPLITRNIEALRAAAVTFI